MSAAAPVETPAVAAPVARPDVLDFELPPELEASSPPEARGGGRGDVRLMVAYRSSGRIEHRRFADLPQLLAPGDLLVVNTSRTIPAALRGTARLPGAGLEGARQPALLHLSTRRDDGHWAVELRHPNPDGRGSAPWLDAPAGTTVSLPAGASAVLLRPARPGPALGAVRLWEADLRLPASTAGYLARHGRPIQYGHLVGDVPLSDHQTVFADQPGSAEMPSAARPFTAELVTRLVTRGVGLAPILLHAGVSSAEAHEPPMPERFRVSRDTAARVNAVRRLGGRVVAVGTTAVRALESAAEGHGLVLPAEGWTDLVIGPERPVQVVDGIVTGWHEPRASHLAMLEAIAGRELLEASYRSALERGYLWHEFGDSHLILS